MVIYLFIIIIMFIYSFIHPYICYLIYVQKWKQDKYITILLSL